MSSHDAILRMLAQMDARQARIEAKLDQILRSSHDHVEHDLLKMIADLTGRETFAVRDLWATVHAMRTAAEAAGEPIPDIARAFDDMGLSSTKSLGRWIAAQDPDVVQRGTKTSVGMIWQIVTLPD